MMLFPNGRRALVYGERMTSSPALDLTQKGQVGNLQAPDQPLGR